MEDLQNSLKQTKQIIILKLETLGNTMFQEIQNKKTIHELSYSSHEKVNKQNHAEIET